MGKEDKHERHQVMNPPETSGDSEQFFRDNRRVDTTQHLLEFGTLVVNTIKEMSADDQGRARPRY